MFIHCPKNNMVLQLYYVTYETIANVTVIVTSGTEDLSADTVLVYEEEPVNGNVTADGSIITNKYTIYKAFEKAADKAAEKLATGDLKAILNDVGEMVKFWIDFTAAYKA